MTILLTKAVRAGGVILASGSTQTLDAAVEGQLVHNGSATYVSDPSTALNDVPVTASKTLTGRIKVSGAQDAINLGRKSVATAVAGVVGGGLDIANTAGKLVSDFVGTKWAVTVGTPTVTRDVTGFDASGNRTGLVSRTGQASMLQIVPTATGDEVRLPYGSLNIALNGRAGLWVHCANVTGYDSGAGPTTGRINMVLSTNAVSVGNGAALSWSIEGQLREGWNFLKFVQKGAVYNNATNLQISSNVFTGAHPYGTGVSYNGTAADSEIGSADLRSIAISFQSCVGWTITLDSIWTGFAGKAAFVIGCDQAAQSCVDVALPIFQQYGWRGYVCSPRGVLANPTTAAYANMIADPIYADIASARVAYPVLGTLYDAGWDVINHTMTHRSQGYLTNPAEVQLEVDRARAWATSGGLIRGSEFYASPNSSTSRLSEKVIAGCGIVLQRHAKKINNTLTAWGFDNPNYLGSHDWGSSSTGQSLAILYNVIDNVCRYGDVYWPFWHNIRTLGDPGDGSGIYAVDGQNIYASNFRLACAYMKAKIDAGEASGVYSPTELYYGV